MYTLVVALPHTNRGNLEQSQLTSRLLKHHAKLERNRCLCALTKTLLLQVTKAAVDGACVVIRGASTPVLEPCYGRAIISGAVAGFTSMCIADSRKFHPSFYAPKDYLLSTHTLVSVVGGSIVGITNENERLHRAQLASV
jgi:hypothetical protein